MPASGPSCASADAQDSIAQMRRSFWNKHPAAAQKYHHDDRLIRQDGILGFNYLKGRTGGILDSPYCE